VCQACDRKEAAIYKLRIRLFRANQKLAMLEESHEALLAEKVRALGFADLEHAIMWMEKEAPKLERMILRRERVSSWEELREKRGLYREI
jgi:hypothetical protein